MWLLYLSGLFQLACTGLAASEMVISMWEIRNATSDDFFQTRSPLLQTLQLFDDVAKLKFIIHMLRYLGVIFLSLASYVMVNVICNRKQYIEVKSGAYMTLQLIGVVALVIRLVVLVLYTLDHVCEADGENLEPNYILLGISAAFGLLGLFLYIGTLFAYIYEKCTKYEDAEKQRKCTCTNLNTCMVYTNTFETLISHPLKISVWNENLNAVNRL